MTPCLLQVHEMNPLMIAASETRRRLGVIGEPGSRFLGEVPTSELITGDALAALLSYTQGVSQYSDTPWLHFNLDGKTLYVAKKQFRHTVDWITQRDNDLVFGTRTVTIKGRLYKIRLLKSIAGDGLLSHGHQNWSYDTVEYHNSEYNRLFYPIAYSEQNPKGSVSSEGIVFASQADYHESELGFSSNNTLYTQCQESWQNTPLERGFYRMASAYVHSTPLGPNPSRQWRPVLELVE